MNNLFPKIVKLQLVPFDMPKHSKSVFTATNAVISDEVAMGFALL